MIIQKQNSNNEKIGDYNILQSMLWCFKIIQETPVFSHWATLRMWWKETWSGLYSKIKKIIKKWHFYAFATIAWQSEINRVLWSNYCAKSKTLRMLDIHVQAQTSVIQNITVSAPSLLFLNSCCRHQLTERVKTGWDRVAVENLFMKRVRVMKRSHTPDPQKRKEKSEIEGEAEWASEQSGCCC